ncbi:MAG TPA: hypothetical protein VNH11_27505 [Pirellulales bacterium]|nr:hypothetical protein [Pirellulales bacterium]
MATQAIDNGKLITARLPGECSQCGGSIEPGDKIYFSRQIGPRHQRCVADNRHEEPTPESSDREAAPSRNPRTDIERQEADRSPARNVYRDLAYREAARAEMAKVLDKVIDALSAIRDVLS